MIGAKRLVVVLVFLFTVQPAYASDAEKRVILQVVSAMNDAWADQDLSTCLSYFAADIDFENSYGWTIRDRKSMGRFLEWLFDRYPKPEGEPATPPDVSSAVEFLGLDLALVDSLRIIGSSGEGSTVRSIRSAYILKKEGGEWLIWKTRIWESKSSNAAPTDLVEADRFGKAEPQ